MLSLNFSGTARDLAEQAWESYDRSVEYCEEARQMAEECTPSEAQSICAAVPQLLLRPLVLAALSSNQMTTSDF
jgi:hypothetical protein